LSLFYGKHSTYFVIISTFILIIGGFISLLYALLIGGICIAASLFWLKTSLETRIYFYSYYPLFKLKVFYSDKEGKGEYLIHSKIYVIDNNIAYLGSANFTYTGFNKSYESVIYIKDRDAVRKISQEVDNLYNNSNLYYKDIQEWGKQIYSEPPHEDSLIKIIVENRPLAK
jgi:phosphatidylserine/phosphatidylglycerophosphate/cardiolipin synthase-like enzyme